MPQRIMVAPATDPADIRKEAQAPLDRAATFPSRILLGNKPVTLDQEGGTCVAHAAYGVYSWWFKTKYGHFPAIGEQEVLKFYDLCKKVDGQPDPTRVMGTTLLTALRTMAGSGFPLANGQRGPHITGYHYVGSTAGSGRLALAQFMSPILFRINWDANWFSLPTNRVLKAPIGQVVGGHAMYEIGYDLSVNTAAQGADIDPNSWGAWSNGGNGICYFGEAYKNRSQAQYECWQVTGIA